MADSKPLVSIGMPVYNGERFIRQALDSLLAQDYEKFELIISDNASIDATPKICEKYVAEDNRVCYYRNERNRGISWNFRHVLELSKGKYFMWAAHDDMWEPSFIFRAVEILETDSSVLLCYAQPVLIDENNNTIRLLPERVDTRSFDLISRANLVVWGFSGGVPLYGLMRLDNLKKAYMRTYPKRPMLSYDLLLLLELSFEGSFAYIQEPLFLRRPSGRHRSDYGQMITLALRYQDSGIQNPFRYLPYWKLGAAIMKATLSAPSRTYLKFLLLVPSVGLAYLTRFRGHLINDLRYMLMSWWPGRGQ